MEGPRMLTPRQSTSVLFSGRIKRSDGCGSRSAKGRIRQPPQERGLLGRSHADEAAPTDSIRSNTSRRMNVWGEPVSSSAVHMEGAIASPQLCIAISVVKESSSSVTVPPTRQGPCSGSARSEAPREVIAKTSGL